MTGAGWRRIETRADFVAAVADRVLTGEGLRFVLHGDGRISGRAGGEALSGRWAWRDGVFCRAASLGADDLGKDCEVIELRDAEMRYTRDRGRGTAHVVAIGAPVT